MTATTSDPATVTVVGIGAMGMPMARRLAAAGHDVVAVDPSAGARARADELGLRSCAGIADAPPTDVVIVLVATGQQLLEVVEAGTADGRAAVQTWVVSSTVGPPAAREATERLAAAGAVVIDAPVTGGVPGAEQGTLRFMAAGDAAAIDAVGDVLSVLGEVAVVGDRPGDGQATKLVNQLCASTHLAVAAEAIAFATQLGLDPVKTLDVIRGGAGSSWFLEDRGPRIAALDTTPPVLTRLAIPAKDLGLVEEAAEACGAHVPVAKAALRQFLRAVELGLLEADDSQVVRTYPSRTA